MKKELQSPMDFDNLIDLVLYFNSVGEKGCLKYLEQMRWGGTIACPHCGSCEKIYRYKDGVRFKCKDCKKGFTAKVGTCFESSKLPMIKWFMAMYLIGTHKKGISSHQLARDIKVTQKSSWFMLHRIREAMIQENSGEQLEGVVECDETFVGGKNINRHKHKKFKGAFGRSFKDKTPVAGILQQGGKVRAKVVKTTASEYIEPFVVQNVKAGSILISDEWRAYTKMHNWFDHYVVDHARRQYVTDAGMTTNTIEGFWTWIKKSINGIYHRVTPKHLQLYVNECVFRYNTRLLTEREKMNYLCSLVNFRTKYTTLINKLTL